MAVNNVAYIEKFMPKVIDQVFAQESLTERLFGKNALKVDFLDAKTVRVFKLASTGLTDYKRGGSGTANSKGAYDTTTEVFPLGQERFAEIPIDKLDSLDDGDTVVGHLATEFARTKVVQEFDAYRFSKLAGYCSKTYGNLVSESISANQVIAKFNAAFKWMKNHKVPSDNQVIYVSTSVMELIRNTTELQKRLISEEKKFGDYYTTIERYEGREIIEVPEDEFYTNIVIGDGYYPQSNSKIINFLIVDTTAPIVIKKLDFVKLYSSDEVKLDYVGYALQELYYHDLFVPENKKPAIYCSVSTTSATDVANALLVNAVAGSSGKTVINDVLTEPAGIMYDALYIKTTSGKPAIGSSTANLTEITIGAEFAPNASHNFIIAGLDGKAVAVSTDFTGTTTTDEDGKLPVGA